MKKGEKGGFGGGGDFARAEETFDQRPVDVVRWQRGCSPLQSVPHEGHPNLLIPLPDKMGKHVGGSDSHVVFEGAIGRAACVREDHGPLQRAQGWVQRSRPMVLEEDFPEKAA